MYWGNVLRYWWYVLEDWEDALSSQSIHNQMPESRFELLCRNACRNAW